MLPVAHCCVCSIIACPGSPVQPYLLFLTCSIPILNIFDSFVLSMQKATIRMNPKFMSLPTTTTITLEHWLCNKCQQLKMNISPLHNIMSRTCRGAAIQARKCHCLHVQTEKNITILFILIKVMPCYFNKSRIRGFFCRIEISINMLCMKLLKYPL